MLRRKFRAEVNFIFDVNGVGTLRVVVIENKIRGTAWRAFDENNIIEWED